MDTYLKNQIRIGSVGRHGIRPNTSHRPPGPLVPCDLQSNHRNGHSRAAMGLTLSHASIWMNNPAAKLHALIWLDDFSLSSIPSPLREAQRHHSCWKNRALQTQANTVWSSSYPTVQLNQHLLPIHNVKSMCAPNVTEAVLQQLQNKTARGWRRKSSHN